MFDVGFWELVIIAVMALVVVGPERLPLLLGKVGRWVGKARAYVATLRGDIEREVQKAEKVVAENDALLKLKEATELARKQAADVKQTMDRPAGTAVDKLMGRDTTNEPSSANNDSESTIENDPAGLPKPLSENRD